MRYKKYSDEEDHSPPIWAAIGSALIVLIIAAILGFGVLKSAEARVFSPNECVGLTIKAMELFKMKEDGNLYHETMKEEVQQMFESQDCKKTDCWVKDDEDLRNVLSLIDFIAEDEVDERYIGSLYYTCLERYRRELRRKSLERGK